MFDPDMDDVVIATRQPRLLHLEGALSVRLGTAFFRSIPTAPGVYSFYDAEGRLLYIGQSADLRARLNSYRHVSPEKNPKRTLRLVARTVRIEWELCDSAAMAIERERVLLLERHPPFNRAGVWQGEPWWLMMECDAEALRLSLSRDSNPQGIGPLPPASRYALASLARCMLRIAYPGWRLSHFPLGLMRAALPLNTRLPLPDAGKAAATVQNFLGGEITALLEALKEIPDAASESEQAFWLEEQERLVKHAARTALR